MSNLPFTNEEFEFVRAKAEEDYKKIGDVQCPYLDSKVQFNTLGMDHLKFKRWSHARARSDQIVRLKLLHLAPSVLRKSHTLQGLDEGNKIERLKVNGCKRWFMSPITNLLPS